MEEVSKQNRQKTVITTLVIFLLFGGLIGASAYVAFIPSKARIILKIVMVLASLILWIGLSRIEQFQKYQNLAISFLAVSLGVLISHYLGYLPGELLKFSTSTIQGVALAKFGEALPIILSILVFHFATGGNRAGLFLRRADSKLGIIAGAIGVGLFLIIAALQAIGSGLMGNTL
jgi:hypothetical protein